MTLWRLEWLRLVRTRRWLALAGVYVIFGLLGPVTAKYIAQIVEFAGSDQEGVVIVIPDPVPADGMAQFVSNAAQVGTLVAVIVAAGALAFDAIPEMGVFLRTRVPDVWEILVPRLAVSFAAAAGAFVLGALAAWYETEALLGPLEPAGVALGTALGVLFLAFVVAVVAAVAQWAKGILATAMGSLVILVVLPIIGIVGAIEPWLPSRLSSALADLTAGGSEEDYWKAILVTVLLTVGLLWVAVRGARLRKV